MTVGESFGPRVTANTRRPQRGIERVDIALLFGFFVSGASALVYQLSWQRAFYSIIGVDIDSVTVVVSAFMLGIGLGGMAGGWLADRYPAKRIHLFAVAELTIAAYGAATISLLPWLDSHLLHTAWSTLGARAALSFAVLALPTTLMGMTLPLLTMAMNDKRQNVGVSVGALYFANTLGAALGALLVPMVLLHHFTLSATIATAAIGNLLVAGSALLAARQA